MGRSPDVLSARNSPTVRSDPTRERTPAQLGSSEEPQGVVLKGSSLTRPATHGKYQRSRQGGVTQREPLAAVSSLGPTAGRPVFESYLLATRYAMPNPNRHC